MNLSPFGHDTIVRHLEVYDAYIMSVTREHNRISGMTKMIIGPTLRTSRLRVVSSLSSPRPPINNWREGVDYRMKDPYGDIDAFMITLLTQR